MDTLAELQRKAELQEATSNTGVAVLQEATAQLARASTDRRRRSSPPVLANPGTPVATARHSWFSPSPGTGRGIVGDLIAAISPSRPVSHNLADKEVEEALAEIAARLTTKSDADTEQGSARELGLQSQLEQLQAREQRLSDTNDELFHMLESLKADNELLASLVKAKQSELDTLQEFYEAGGAGVVATRTIQFRTIETAASQTSLVSPQRWLSPHTPLGEKPAPRPNIARGFHCASEEPDPTAETGNMDEGFERTKAILTSTFLHKMVRRWQRRKHASVFMMWRDVVDELQAMRKLPDHFTRSSSSGSILGEASQQRMRLIEITRFKHRWRLLLKSRLLATAWDAFSEIMQASRDELRRARILQQIGRRLSHRLLVVALGKWEDVIDSGKVEAGRQRSLRQVCVRMRSHLLAQALAIWECESIHSRCQRVSLWRVSSRVSKALCQAMFIFWEKSCTLQKHRRRACSKIANRWQNLLLSSAFWRWSQHVEEGHLLYHFTVKLTLRRNRLCLATAWAALEGNVLQQTKAAGKESAQNAIWHVFDRKHKRHGRRQLLATSFLKLASIVCKDKPIVPWGACFSASARTSMMSFKPCFL